QAMAGVVVDPAEAAALMAASLAAFVRLDDHFGAGTVRTMEAVAALVAGDHDRTATAAAAALDHAGRCGDRFVPGRVAWIEGLLAGARGDAAAAYRHTERGLRLLDELGMGQEVTAQAGLLVALAERRGEPELAAQWRTFVAGRSGGMTRHDALLMASARNGEGLEARRAGDPDRARAAHLEALAGYEDAGVRAAVAFTRSCLGFLAAATGDDAGARDHHAAALDAAAAAAEPAALALALEGVATTFDDADAWEATVLLGAAGRAWEESAVAGGASHRDDVAALTDRVRGRLGAAALAAAREQGAGLDRDEAVARARVGPGSATSGPRQPEGSP
ncbi:MAG TPA: hypothetical protein VGO78_19690, partial [Acidimicrobiales bacterium]|nr:hypothetical protein [Acidimicrobiales bacterium]